VAQRTASAFSIAATGGGLKALQLAAGKVDWNARSMRIIEAGAGPAVRYQVSFSPADGTAFFAPWTQRANHLDLRCQAGFSDRERRDAGSGSFGPAGAVV
jgi:hypothetical protein